MKKIDQGKERSIFIKETLFATLSNVVGALVINLLAWQFKQVSGGFVGYSLLLNLLTQIPTGTILLGLNALLILIAIIVVGKGVGFRAIYGFVTLSLFIDMSRFGLSLEQNPVEDFGVKLVLIIALAVLMGSLVSVLLANNYSVGSYSTIYMIVKKFIDTEASTVFLIMDAILALVSILVLGWETGVLLAINAVVAYFTVKLVLPPMKTFFGKINS